MSPYPFIVALFGDRSSSLCALAGLLPVVSREKLHFSTPTSANCLVAIKIASNAPVRISNVKTPGHTAFRQESESRYRSSRSGFQEMALNFLSCASVLTQRILLYLQVFASRNLTLYCSISGQDYQFARLAGAAVAISIRAPCRCLIWSISCFFDMNSSSMPCEFASLRPVGRFSDIAFTWRPFTITS